ncbi:MAG: RNA polymerase subunit sigma [Firmicutes bacterium HGW-Firmicutes-12]|jgi:RNA polymerase sigma-70 factor (ECF subfamily)|nr:MAG: RNA polymerase subunit sigma [Firmicutes bacterium HGW-Firmicutes-12]
MYSEAQILEGLLKNEEAAVFEIINLYGDRMLRTAFAITGDAQTAEEVVQDTFLQVCQKIDSFRQHSTLQTWIYRITVNLAKNRLRSRWFKKVTPLAEELTTQVQIPNNSENNPETVAIQEESRREVLSTLQGLSEKYRAVLVLHYLEEQSIKEISEILKQPEGTIKSKLSRGKTLLKKELLKREVVSK